MDTPKQPIPPLDAIGEATLRLSTIGYQLGVTHKTAMGHLRAVVDAGHWMTDADFARLKAQEFVLDSRTLSPHELFEKWDMEPYQRILADAMGNALA